jgi:biotin-(acetyl-CoA carboxylase) ligase
LKWRVDLQSPAFLQSWEARLAYRNQPVQVYLDMEKDAGSPPQPLIEGHIQGLNADGSLRLRTFDGTVQSLTVGELSLRAS